MYKNYYEEILEYVNSLTIIDSHEHFECPRPPQKVNPDFLNDHVACMNRELRSAHIKPEDLAFARDVEQPLMARWDRIEPYWKLVRRSGDGMMNEFAAKGIYGVDHIGRDTIEELTDIYSSLFKQPGYDHFHRVMRELCKIEFSMTDHQHGDLNFDERYFKGVYRVEWLVNPVTWEQMEGLAEASGVLLNSFDAWLEVCRCTIEKAMTKVSVFKTALAYARSLRFERASRKDAEDCFNAMYRKKNTDYYMGFRAVEANKAFQDYMMHYILGMVERKGMVFQFHTGALANGAMLENSNPILLNNLFLEYPNIQFDIFHIGYPFQDVVANFAKVYPHVHLNMCWMHHYAPTTTANTLNEWLDTVTLNKIIAFGGDNGYGAEDGIYGHLCLAKRNISQVLAQKVEQGRFDLEEAKWIAKLMFYDNPKALYDR